MNTLRLHIIILQYNNSSDTINCLQSVMALDYPNLKILVIDNASAPEHLQKLKNFISGLSATRYPLFACPENLGYSGGNNLGIKKALEENADYVLILNPDTIVDKDLLGKLVETGESDPKIGLLGPAIDEGNRTVYGGMVEWLKPELKHNYNLKFKIDNSRLYLPGSALLVKKQVFKRIGLFDERYFLYFEDADFCLRARAAGYQLMIAPEAKVQHGVSASTLQLGSARLLRYHFRNAHLFNAEHAPWKKRILLPIWSFFIIIKQLAKIALLPDKRQVSKAILAGVLDFYLDNWGKS